MGRAPRSDLVIDRCVCRQLHFVELRRLALEGDWSLDALSRATGAGAQCGLCRPYLRRMLADGTTVFHEILPPEEASG